MENAVPWLEAVKGINGEKTVSKSEVEHLQCLFRPGKTLLNFAKIRCTIIYKSLCICIYLCIYISI